MEEDYDPGPVPDEPDGSGELTAEEYANLHNTIDVTHFLFGQMLGELAASGSVASMYAPFQPLIRTTMIAAVAYYRDHDQPELAQRAQTLLDSELLDSPTVARAPTPQEVIDLMIKRMEDERSTDTADLYDKPEQAIMREVIADAMDCAYKQAMQAPQTRGSRFARKGESSK